MSGRIEDLKDNPKRFQEIEARIKLLGDSRYRQAKLMEVSRVTIDFFYDEKKISDVTLAKLEKALEKIDPSRVDNGVLRAKGSSVVNLSTISLDDLLSEIESRGWIITITKKV